MNSTSSNAPIKTHRELAIRIKGCRILHLNSLGKDSALTLEWLSRFAAPEHVVSVFFKPIASHPDDDRYLEYQKRRHPQIEFLVQPNGHELNNLVAGRYQLPLETIAEFNAWDYTHFYFELHARDIMREYGLEFMALGFSCYESFTRASLFHKKGILIGDQIFPIGLLKKKQVIQLIKDTGLKLHPVYGLSETTLDFPSYYKMKRAFELDPEYKRRVIDVFPMLPLDEYRWRVLLGKK